MNGDYSRESSVTSMLKELKWSILKQRRTNTKMVMMYRIVHHLIAIPSQIALLLQPPEQQEAMTKNSKYHSREYRATKTHTSLQRPKHGIACQQS